MVEPPVMVVDDDPLVASLIRDALEDAGYCVASASSAEHGLQLLDEMGGAWAGVVTDINLGARSPPGWEVARRARQMNPAVPVIYVSGDSSHEWAVYGVPRSVMIGKPFTPSQVVVALADLLNASAAAV